MLGDGFRDDPQHQCLNGVQQRQKDPSDGQHRQKPQTPHPIDEQDGAVPEQRRDAGDESYVPRSGNPRPSSTTLREATSQMVVSQPKRSTGRF